MKNERLLSRIKSTILAIEPNAEIFLFGSRSRGDSTPESDWDFLILLEGQVDHQRKDRLRHCLYEIEWEENEVLSSLIWNKVKWNVEPYRQMPLHEHVAREGIRL